MPGLPPPRHFPTLRIPVVRAHSGGGPLPIRFADLRVTAYFGLRPRPWPALSGWYTPRGDGWPHRFVQVEDADLDHNAGDRQHERASRGSIAQNLPKMVSGFEGKGEGTP